MASPTENPKKGQIGLANLGNTCYLNAILQCLRHIPDLTVFMNKHSEPWIHKEGKDAQFCRAYKDLVENIWQAEPPGFMKPAGFYHYYRKALEGTAVDHLMMPLPHDSHEALVFVLDQLHEGMKKKIEINVTAAPGTQTHRALTAWKDQVGPQYSPIVDYFFGLMEVSVICSGCKNVSRRFETFNMLKVGFPESKQATLDACLNYEFQDEHIDDYSCDKCSPKRHAAAIRRRIWRLPNNLIVVAKRFNPNGTKCHAALQAESEQVFSNWFSEDSPESSGKATYALQGIVDHHGSAGGGHYTAQIRSPISGGWGLYDDESVGQIGDGSKPHVGQTSYILFYRRV